jgi:hypothetical protein
MLIRGLVLIVAIAGFAGAADPYSFVGTVVNTTNPNKPVAAPVRMVIGQDGTCSLTISPPLVGSGSCAIKSYEEKSGRLEITSVGTVNIDWIGTVKGNFVSGSYRVSPGSQSGSFYLAIVGQEASALKPKPQMMPPIVPRSYGGCSPAIESSISGDFHGWDGETIFKLDNGQIWQQAEYDYTYSYSYHPDVTIYETRAGCRIKVEDEEETILVKRIK